VRGAAAWGLGPSHGPKTKTASAERREPSLRFRESAKRANSIGPSTNQMTESPLLITPEMLLSRRVDFERRMRRLPPVTLGLLGLLVLFLPISAGGPHTPDALIDSGALVPSLVHEGEYWRLLSATFLHGSLQHFLGNALALFILGMVCEHAFGKRQFVILYVASALAGSLVSIVTSAGPSVGASGAIFGLQGAAVVLFYRYRDQLHVRDKRIGFVLFVWAVANILGGLVTPYIDNGAHIGGALGGSLVARAMHPVVLNQPAAPEHLRRLTTIFWLTVAGLACTLVAWLR
jgi:rhomboid protease GluP